MKKLLFGVIVLFSTQWLQAQAPDIQWQRNYGGDETENFTGLGESPDGYFYFAGTSTSPASGDRTQARRGQYDFWIVKTDANGNIIWNKAVGGGGATRMNSMTVTADGGIILAGNTDAGANFEKSEPNRGPAGTVDIWVIKLDANGNKVWDKTLGGTGAEAPFAIAETPDGGCIVAGESTSPASGDKTENNFGGFQDCWVIRLNNNGQKLWDKIYGGTGAEAFYSVSNTLDGGFIFGGVSNSGVSGNKTEPSRGGNDCWLVKTDANGNIQWDKTYGGDKSEEVYSIKQLGSGDYIIGAYSESGISGDKTIVSKGGGDLWLLKLKNSGNIIWQRGIGGNSSDGIRNIAITDDHSIFIGISSSSPLSGDKTVPDFGGGSHYWIVKTDSNGLIQWQNSYGDVSNDGLKDVIQTSDKGFLLGGFSNKWRKGDYWIIKLKPETSTSIFDKNPASFSLYPNPAKNQLTIRLNGKILNDVTTMDFYSLDGRLLQSETLSFQDGAAQIEMNLPNGMYLLRCNIGNEIFSERFLVAQ
jgi:hypothetical protein